MDLQHTNKAKRITEGGVSKKKDTKARNYYSACHDCNIKQGGVTPKNQMAVTCSMGTCPYCKRKEQTLIPWVDYDWPKDKTLTAHARAQRD